ncbi:uncharacterized protein LOC128451126 [Pleuronectes platessa]|uniref:uncharacterized protein LOC128451126 n=1 Tax=Pleuronectes platessa TaxID=8262 RepID=UPI00232A67E0|nr:uncharacterized protein LOC128451126 [Pleuronectes platessa]
MNSNQDDSTGGKPSHRDMRSKGSGSTVRLGSRSVPVYPLVTVCLGVLNTILLLTAVVIGIYCGKVDKESAPEQMTTSTLLIEVKQLQFIQSGAVQVQKETEDKLEKAGRSIEQLQRQIERNKTLGDAIQRQLETLHVERATTKSSSSDIRLNCERCPSGWIWLNESCYFHSKSDAGPLKSWANSREDCIRRGGDLAVIEDRVEQVKLDDYLPKLAGNRDWTKAGPGIWIGFTLQAGDTWMWVNNATLLGEGFWIDGEPNQEGPHNKSCGAIMNMVNLEKSWFSGHCLAKKEWLCEVGPIMESPQRRTNHHVGELLSGDYSKFAAGGFTWPNTRLVILCLALLNAVLLIVAVVIGINCAKVKESSYQVSHSAATQLISELSDLRSNHSDMLEATEDVKAELRSAFKNYAQLQVTTEQLTAANKDYRRHVETLRLEKTSLQFNLSALEGTCGRCLPSWTFRNSSCYYFSCLQSTTAKKNWHDSREDCISRGADLVVIDNQKEQEYVTNCIRSYYGQGGWVRGSWIGLTDIVTEGTWIWINNVTEVEKRYWKDGEPNNHGPEGENCCSIGYASTNPWKTWVDAKCEEHKLHWICEMPSG